MRRTANQRFLGAMLDMGIPQEHAELALAETNNVGVEVRRCVQTAARRPATVKGACTRATSNMTMLTSWDAYPFGPPNHRALISSGPVG